jgi:hypothetical protein
MSRRSGEAAEADNHSDISLTITYGHTTHICSSPERCRRNVMGHREVNLAYVRAQ